MQETFYRPPEVARESRRLPAETYNLALVLWRQSRGDGLFVPIRTMQYLAVVDDAEIIFVHREGRRMIEIAWQSFHPEVRESLADPVPYELVTYAGADPGGVQRLPMEFLQALRSLAQKNRPSAPTRVVPLRRPDRS
jgi:hypothetical protein